MARTLSKRGQNILAWYGEGWVGFAFLTGEQGVSILFLMEAVHPLPVMTRRVAEQGKDVTWPSEPAEHQTIIS